MAEITETVSLRSSVRVVRHAALHAAMGAANGRATAFNFAGIAGRDTWIGNVSMAPGACTGAHHHGATEVAIYVVQGRGQIRWGARLDFAAEIGPGDFVYFEPHVPHQELNLDANEALEFVAVRSNDERIVVKLAIEPVPEPESVF